MTDLLTENARLRAALEKALNYIENTESELGITLGCGECARNALATPAPDAVQEAARVLLVALFPKDETWGEFTRGDALKACQDHHISSRQFQAALRAITGDRT